MSTPSSGAKRNFVCDHCGKTITIPAELPSTTGPCPHCGESVTSPAPIGEEPAVRLQPAASKPLPASPPLEPVSQTGGETAARETAKKEGSSVQWLLVGIAGLVGLGAIAVVGKILLTPKKAGSQEAGLASSPAASLSPSERASNAFQQKGWLKEANQTLEAFFAAETAAERAAVTLSAAEEIADFYQAVPFSESDTDLEGFAPVFLGEEDTSRGLFLMNYSRPSQFAIQGFFRPVPPLRVRYGLESPDPLLMGEAALENFVEDPVRTMAFFKQQEDGSLLLDWETFVQTKHRLLREFVENPSPGRQGVFRVFVQEDVDLDGRDGEGTSVFRLSDPANRSDFAKVLVRDDSPLGQAFAPLKWRGRVVRVAPSRNATVTLVWSNDETPSLQLGGLLCWQFLKLGGELGNWKEELEARQKSQLESVHE